MKELSVESPAFENNKFIPTKYTCDGDDVNPSLVIKGIPEEAKTLVLIVDDPDAPTGTWNHWIVWNIPASAGGIPEGGLPEGSVQGANIRGANEYMGPGAPAGPRYHHYVFELYALNANLDLPATASRPELLAAMDGKVVAKAAYVGRYKGTPQ